MTAIRAVADFQSSMALQLVNSGAMVHNSAEANALMTKEVRVWLKGKIFKAWRDQRKVPFKQVNALSCYAAVPPAERTDGLIDNYPLQCTLADCCLRPQFTSNLDPQARAGLPNLPCETRDE